MFAPSQVFPSPHNFKLTTIMRDWIQWLVSMLNTTIRHTETRNAIARAFLKNLTTLLRDEAILLQWQ
jgi:hypothetical protein